MSSGVAALHSVPQQDAAHGPPAPNRAEESLGLAAEIEKLRRQLEQAQQDSQAWRQLHSELHSAFVKKVLRT